VTLLRSLLFQLLSNIWSWSLMILCLPLLLGPRRWVVAAGRFWIGGLHWLLRTVCGLDYEVTGREHLPEGPCIIASKHQSAWDTIAMPAIFPDPAFVLKRELLWIPLFGLYLAKAENLAVDRSGGSAALRRMVEDARAIAAEGRKIVIYPEGTRTAPGRRIAYHPGVAALYQQLQLPVTPVALDSGLYWARRRLLKRPGRIQVEIRPPIPPGLPRREFMRRLESEIEDSSDRLRTRATGGEKT
jgi:1-acyl-sn-glycerol-3-phosphate acyltransferase